MSFIAEFQVKIQDKLCVGQYLMMYILDSFYAKIKFGRRQIPFFSLFIWYPGALKDWVRMSKIVKSYLDSRTKDWTAKIADLYWPW